MYRGSIFALGAKGRGFKSRSSEKMTRKIKIHPFKTNHILLKKTVDILLDRTFIFDNARDFNLVFKFGKKKVSQLQTFMLGLGSARAHYQILNGAKAPTNCIHLTDALDFKVFVEHFLTKQYKNQYHLKFTSDINLRILYG